MSMWEKLGGLRDVVKDGLQEFSKEALRESTLIRSTVVENVTPVVQRGKEVVGSVAPVVQRGKEVVENAAPVPHRGKEAVGTSKRNAKKNSSKITIVRVDAKEDKKLVRTNSKSKLAKGDNDETNAGGRLVESETSASEVAQRPFATIEAVQDFPGASEEASSVGQVNGNEEANAKLHSENEPSPTSGAEAFVLVAEGEDAEEERVSSERRSENRRIHGQLSELEDELEKARAQGVRMEAELKRLHTASALALQMKEDQIQSLQSEVKTMQEKLQAADTLISVKDIASASAKKEREVLEEQVKAMAANLEKRMEALTGELAARQAEADELREENDGMAKAFTELRTMVKESVAERDRLTEIVADRDKALEEARASAAQAEGEGEKAHREVAEVSAELADVRAELWAVREAAKGKALGEDERLSLEAAVKAVSASAQQAAVESQKWQSQAESLERQVSNQKRLLTLAEAEASLARQQALEAQAEAEEARRLKAEAEGTSEQLREQTDRRARVFNAAVKAAVAKIQAELEGDRDSAVARINELESEAAAYVATIAEEQEQRQEARKELDELRLTAQETESQLQNTREELNKARSRATESEKAAALNAQSARDAITSLRTKVAEMEVQVSELQKDLESARAETSTNGSKLQLELEQAQEALATVEREKASLKVAVLEASTRSGEEVAILRGRIAEMEGRLGVSESRVQRMTQEQQVATKLVRNSSALDDLGLDGIREERLRFKDRLNAGDIEAVESLIESKARRGKRGNVVTSSLSSSELSGRISRRSFLIIVYIAILHIMVMASFRRHACGEIVGKGELQLPGM